MASRPSNQFCSPECKNRYNVYKTRAKQKENEEESWRVKMNEMLFFDSGGLIYTFSEIRFSRAGQQVLAVRLYNLLKRYHELIVYIIFEANYRSRAYSFIFNTRKKSRTSPMEHIIAEINRLSQFNIQNIMKEKKTTKQINNPMREIVRHFLLILFPTRCLSKFLYNRWGHTLLIHPNLE